MKKRVKWIPHVITHMESIPNIITTQHCNVTCSEGCDITSWATKRIAEMCAEASFGSACLEGNFNVKLGLKKNHDANVDWFHMVKAFRVVDASGKASIQYKVDSHTVCQATWAAFYGLQAWTSRTIHVAVLKGADAWNDSLAKATHAATKQLKATWTKAATAWWHIRLGYYEMIVESRPPSIMHPRSVVWKTVYSDEFIPEVRLLGLAWKSPDSDGASGSCDEKEMGSMTTWTRGRTNALKELAQMHLPSDSGHAAFKFVSRADHSAYVSLWLTRALPFPFYHLIASPCPTVWQKECSTCQQLRLQVEKAIRDKASPAMIRDFKLHYAQHLQWMLTQRAKFERMLQLSGNAGYVVLVSDKCGDSCLYLPAEGRVAADNAGRYRYRISLQADVYAGKLYHLSILLPNLTTGANFGITSMLTGLVRMIQLGEVTDETRQFERGNDGGSEYVALAGLAMNSTLVGKGVRRFDNLVQNRLPPGHSHHWLTDGTFSVIEGWTTGPGFAGCSTLPELVTFLYKKFASAKSFKDKLVEIKVLLVNFAFVKWFSGHVNADKVKRIGDPLVWRHSWVASEERVKVQYKYALSDLPSFERDEWGPWEER